MRSLKMSRVVPIFVIALIAGCSTKPNDAQLATNLKAQMFSDPQTKNADLQVAVKNGVVTLSGTAPSDAARYEAYKLAAGMPGVSKINDQMAVQAPVQTADAAPPPVVSPPVVIAPSTERKAAHKTKRKEPRKHRHPAERAESAKEADPQATTTVAPAQPVSQPAPSSPLATTSAPPLSQAPPPAVNPAPPQPPVTAVFPAGTTVEVQTIDPIDSTTGQAGDQFQATLARPLTWNGNVLVPKGANVYLRLVAAQTSGQYKGKSELQLELARLEFQGTDYPLQSATYTEAGSSRGQDTAKKVGVGAVLGGIIGAIAGGGKGAAIGGAAGAGAGGVYQGVSKPKQVRIPSETKLDFKLDQPVNISVPQGSGAQ